MPRFSLPRPVAIVGAAAVSAYGLEWRGLGQALLDTDIPFLTSSELALTHPGTLASEVRPIAPADDAGDVRQRKLMARAARLAAIAARRAIKESGLEWARDDLGFYLGVGASGGAIGDLEAILRASIEGRAVSLARLGDQGLSASNPVATFQLLNNFTLCHAAILEGAGGPNGAFFSRGGGTVFALMEAAVALADGDCDRALAGGADSALHPVTYAEVVREGYASRGFVPGEGAGLLALASRAPSPLAFVERAFLFTGRAAALDEGSAPDASPDGTRAGSPADARALADALAQARLVLQPPIPDLVVLAPWGDPPRAALRAFTASALPSALVIDVSLGLGDALAAAPALAWLAALDLLVSGTSRRAVVLSAGIDGQLGVVSLARAAPKPGGAR
jgi:3-oxoacyl-[acyl-carrier-protein] synthase II